MKYIKFIILTAILSTAFTGCSYVSDMVEGAITTRASFSADAVYNSSDNTVTISWNNTDSGDSFAGIEIYRTSKADREFSDYELVASRHETSLLNSGNLASGSTTSCNVETITLDDPSTVSGTFFYRVGFISIDKDDNDVYYNPANTYEYNSYTDISEISGYAKVEIP